MNFFKKLFGCKCKDCCPHKEGEVCNCQSKEKCCKQDSPKVEEAPSQAPTENVAEGGNPQM